MAKKQEDDEFEEFEEDNEEEEQEEEEEEEEEPLPKLPTKKPFQQQIKKAVVEETKKPFQQQRKPEVLQDEEPEQQIQYVPVPRAVPMESMLNEIFDQNQTIIQLLQQLLDKR